MTTNINSYGGNNSFTGVKSYESGSIADNIVGTTLQSVNSQTGAQLTTQMSNMMLPPGVLPNQVKKAVGYTPTQFRTLASTAAVSFLNTVNTSNAGLTFNSNQVLKLPSGAQVLKVIVQPYGYDTLPSGVTTTIVGANVASEFQMGFSATLNDGTANNVLAAGATSIADAINNGIVITNIIPTTFTTAPAGNVSQLTLGAENCFSITADVGGGAGTANTSGDLQVTIFYIGA
jgi:hypothetical protein